MEQHSRFRRKLWGMRPREIKIFVGDGQYLLVVLLAYFKRKHGIGTYRIKEILSDDWRDM